MQTQIRRRKDVLTFCILSLAFSFMIFPYEMTSSKQPVELSNIIDQDINISASWTLTGTPISITGNAGWESAKNAHDWCSGSGTAIDPYVIENVTIDGLATGSCITIQSSTVYFVIRNCHLYNAGTGLQDAGLKLFSVDNGLIENCNISYNGEHGIYLYIDADYITVKDCIISNNAQDAIGITPSTSTQSGHIFSGNTIMDNAAKGIAVSSNLAGAKILDNFISGNTVNLDLQSSRYLTISGNTIEQGTTYGILGLFYNSTIEKNVFDNCGTGLYLYGTPGSNSNYNNISINAFTLNTNGIHFGSYTNFNTMWFNDFESNTDDVDDPGTNYWDNGSIGNYWDTYGGSDGNGDGIGEDAHDVLGTASAPYDNYPLVNPSVSISNILIAGDGVYGHDWNWWKAISWWLTGSGTIGDPYIVEGLKMDAGSSGSCLAICDDDTNYFTVQDCSFTGAEDNNYYAGVMLNNTNHGSVINNTCTGNGKYGIIIWYCNNTLVQGNDASYSGGTSGEGIMNAYGNNNSFIMNTVVGNALVGIQIWRGENIVVFKNTVLNHLGPTDRGIHLHLGGDNFVNVSENIIDNNYYGIYLYGEADDIIHGNTITNNYNAIEFYSFPGSEGTFFNISHNLIKDNTHYGIHFDDAAEKGIVDIFGNEFDGNSQHIQKDPVASFNIDFNNSQYGNEWDGYSGTDANDDFIGDLSYSPPGMFGYADYLPIFEDGDDLAPSILFVSPSNNSKFEDAPSVEIEITDAYGIDSSWYEFVGKSSNISLVGNTILINSSIWGTVSPGQTLRLRVYANDTSGHFNIAELAIKIPDETQPGDNGISGYAGLVFVSLTSCIVAIGIAKRKIRH